MRRFGYLQVDDENRLIWCNHKAKDLLGIALKPNAQPRLLLELVRSYELDQLVEQTRQANRSQQRGLDVFIRSTLTR